MRIAIAGLSMAALVGCAAEPRSFDHQSSLQLDARGVAADAASDGASVTSVGRCREEGSVASALWDSVKPKKMHQ